MDWEEHKRRAFDAFCKRLLKNEAINIRKERARHSNHEVTFSELSDQEHLGIQHIDSYAPDRRVFYVLDMAVEIKDSDLGKALDTLKQGRRKIILAHLLGMSDNEIAQQFHMTRSSVQHQRTSIIKELRDLLGDYQYE